MNGLDAADVDQAVILLFMMFHQRHWGKTRIAPFCDNLHRSSVVMLTFAEKGFNIKSNRSNLPLIPPNIYCTKDLIWFDAAECDMMRYFRNRFVALPPPYLTFLLWLDCMFVCLNECLWCSRIKTHLASPRIKKQGLCVCGRHLRRT